MLQSIGEELPKMLTTKSSTDTLTDGGSLAIPQKDSISTSPMRTEVASPVPGTEEPSFITHLEGDSPSLTLQRTTTNPSPMFTLPLWSKSLILFTLSWCALSVTFSSTSLFAAVSEISSTFDTTSNAISISNAAVLFTMGCSSFVWAPIARLVGRKTSWMAACLVFLAASVGTAMSNSMGLFVAMRVLGGLEGTFFHVIGQSLLAEVFEPLQRGTATGFFLCGTVFGPAFGACIGGIIVTFTSWRVILWLQVAMIGFGMILSIFMVPNVKQTESKNSNADNQVESDFVHVLQEFNFTRVFKKMAYPNVLFTDLVCGLLSWSQYTLLAAPRHILTPRFHFNTPLVAGLFYVSPGIGFLIGTILGGRFSDLTVRKWIQRRGGMRLPQDRLNSGLVSFFLVVPAASLTYGWGLQFEVGGLALPIVTAFFCAAGLLFAFASVNTYCAEVMPKQRPDVIAGKYFVQYTFASIGSAAIIPMIDAIGIGAASTISSCFVLIAGVLALVTARYGLAMQRWMENKLR